MPSLKDKLLNPKYQNPFSAVDSAGKHGGDKTAAFLDPSGWILDTGPTNKREADKLAAKAKAKRKKKRLARSRAMGAPYSCGGKVKMKSGGKVNCRGMGCATRGGRYHKDG